jgi:hypothetical protein
MLLEDTGYTRDMLQEDTGYSWDRLPNTLPKDNGYTRDLLPENVGYSWEILLKQHCQSVRYAARRSKTDRNGHTNTPFGPSRRGFY